MKLTLSFAVLCLLATSVATAGPLTKLPDPKAPKDAVNVAPGGSRWSVGAGVVFREIESDFHLTSPGPLRPRFGRRPGSGRGNVGFYNGVGDDTVGGAGTVTYDDGFVGSGFLGPDGTAYGQFNSASQLTPTNRADGSSDGTNTLFELAFHTQSIGYQYLHDYSPRSFDSSDEETGVGPYLDLRYALFQGERVDVNVLFVYSWVSADLGSGTGLLGTHTVTERRTHDRFTYVYDHDPGFDIATNASKVYDAALFNSTYPGAQAIDPRSSRNRSVSNRTVAEFFAIGSASLDVDLHELVLGPEMSCDVGKRLHVGLSLGPTLNFVNTDLDAQAAWYRKGSSEPLATYRYSSSGTETLLGAAGQLSVTFDITECLFIQASGSYRWVDDFDVQAGFAKANVDLSAWQGALGFGIRL